MKIGPLQAVLFQDLFGKCSYLTSAPFSESDFKCFLLQCAGFKNYLTYIGSILSIDLRLTTFYINKHILRLDIRISTMLQTAFRNR